MEWFGRKNVFNTEQEQGWLVNTEKVGFDTEDGWKKYVDSKRHEITCGQAPYIVLRYDAATGELLEIRQRIGILDRKLRVVNENIPNIYQILLSFQYTKSNYTDDYLIFRFCQPAGGFVLCMLDLRFTYIVLEYTTNVYM